LPVHALSSPSGRLDRYREVGLEIGRVFDAHREPDEAVGDAELLAVRLGNRGVGHDRRVLDERLDAAQRLGAAKICHRLQEPTRASRPPFMSKVIMPPKPFICFLRELVLRVARQARVGDRSPCGCASSQSAILSRSPRGAAMRTCRVLMPRRHQKRVHRAGHAAHGVLQEGERSAQACRWSQHAADHVGVAVEVLGRRVA
jgi:hypothetical protein